MKRVARIAPLLSLCILLLLATISTNQIGFAQNKPGQKAPAAQAPAMPAPQWLSVNVVRVKPDMLLEYQEFAKNETIPTLQKGGVKSREAWTTANFGEAYEYFYVTPIENLSQYDSPGPVIKALGEDGARAYGAKARRFIESSHTFAIQTRPDLSYAGKMGDAPKIAVVNWISIAPGRSADFENLIKSDVLPAVKKAGLQGYLVSQVMFGGDAYQYITLALADSFAEISKGSPVMRGMGQEAFNRFLPRVAGIILHQERAVVRFVPDLSFPAPAKTEAR
ncbi:MAG TPA: hypothetical protein VNN73_04380 [Blastocatellia bacterium]|nr:hypothetical protein [Blastocatellia bacterium]